MLFFMFKEFPQDGNFDFWRVMNTTRNLVTKRGWASVFKIGKWSSCISKMGIKKNDLKTGLELFDKDFFLNKNSPINGINVIHQFLNRGHRATVF